MTRPAFYQIRVQGHLSDRWADWFGGLALLNEPGGEAVLSGALPDQAALYGVLNRIRNLGLTLVSVNRSAGNFEETSHGEPASILGAQVERHHGCCKVP
jgi:hypothetical protein